MPMRRFFLLLSFLLLVIFAQNVSAIEVPAGGTSILQSTNWFSEVGGDPCSDPCMALVDSEVFSYTSESFNYVFTYQITNTSDADLTWFSVTFDAVNVYEPSWDSSDPCWVDPDDWYIIGSPAESIQGIFKETISPSEISAILWFKSDYGPNPDLGSGYLAGIPPGPVFASGELIVPIPEPATLVLLVAGGLIALTHKRRP
jgi:hypothetical protein